MPIFGKSGYLNTVDQFLKHWSEANAELGADGPLVVRLDDGSTINLPGLLARRREMESSLQVLQEKIVDASETAQILNIAMRAILFRARSLERIVRSDHPTYPEIRSLPRVPEFTAERQQFVSTLRSIGRFWSDLNQFRNSQLYLAGRYGISKFEAELANLEDVWADADTARATRIIVEEEREAVLLPIPKILLQYREAVLTVFRRNEPLATRIPHLYASPGPVPAPVKAAGVWNAEKEMGKISWESSMETELDRYEIRYSPGNVYDPDVESTIASVRSTAPKYWLTLEGIREKGRTALFKVYVILRSGNEAGSETIGITNGVDDE